MLTLITPCAAGDAIPAKAVLFSVLVSVFSISGMWGKDAGISVNEFCWGACRTCVVTSLVSTEEAPGWAIPLRCIQTGTTTSKGLG
jgi:hypothetical protein